MFLLETVLEMISTRLSVSESMTLSARDGVNGDEGSIVYEVRRTNRE